MRRLIFQTLLELKSSAWAPAEIFVLDMKFLHTMKKIFLSYYNVFIVLHGLLYLTRKVCKPDCELKIEKIWAIFIFQMDLLTLFLHHKDHFGSL